MRIGLLLCGVLAGCAGVPEPPPDPADLLVFAPHPDDEALGCAGIIRRTLAEGKRVKVVLFTSGDGFPGFASLLVRKPTEQLTPDDFLELARYRQKQSQAAFRTLGGSPGDLLFLGYPDAGLDQVYLARTGAPFRQKFTQRAATERGAPYTYASVLTDVVDLIRTFKPGRLCVTSEADRHRDHQAAFRFVRDGAKAAGYGGVLQTYLIHGGPEWPWPLGVTPQSRLEAHDVKGERIPQGVAWPPPSRISLSTEEIRLKQAAIRDHSTHLAGILQGPLLQEREYLESFVKSEEVFWPVDPK
ncbi:MAG: PIG-L family deacetylase [Planctomycetes bacterium]|nr:PIG-L family deacetylase [Planctomycetota bacterium]